MAAATPDRFRALHYTDTNENDSSDTTLNSTIENPAKLAMDKSSSNGSGNRTKEGQKSANTKVDMAMIGESVSQVVKAIYFVMASFVTTAVTAATKEILASFATMQTQLTREGQLLKREVQVQKFHLDRHEQFCHEIGCTCMQNKAT